jgi:hypothetical protein
MEPTFQKIILYVVAFHILILIVYMPIVYLCRTHKNQKAKRYEILNNAIKFYIKKTKASDFLSVFTVNGEKPVIHHATTQYGYYVLQGENQIQVAYQWQPLWANLFRKVAGLSYTLGIKENTVDTKIITVTAKPDTEYNLYYDHSAKDFVFEEIEKLKS